LYETEGLLSRFTKLIFFYTQLTSEIVIFMLFSDYYSLSILAKILKIKSLKDYVFLLVMFMLCYQVFTNLFSVLFDIFLVYILIQKTKEERNTNDYVKSEKV
jgi:hypothetical protein